MKLEDIMQKVIRARGFRDEITVSISDILRKSENAGLIVRREGKSIPIDLCEQGSTFLTEVADQDGAKRKLCFVSLGSYPVICDGQGVSLKKKEVAYPTAWCFCKQRDGIQWVGFKVFARLSLRYNRFAHLTFIRQNNNVGYVAEGKKETIFIPLKEIHSSFMRMLDGSCMCGPFIWDKSAALACYWLAHNFTKNKKNAQAVLAMKELVIQGKKNNQSENLLHTLNEKFNISSPGKVAHLWRIIQGRLD